MKKKYENQENLYERPHIKQKILFLDAHFVAYR